MGADGIKRKIDGLRRRVKSLYLRSGIARVALAIVALFLLSYLLDYLLDLPLPVRYASFVIALGVLVLAVWRFIARPLAKRISDRDLVLAAESRIPDLQDRLISAHEFRRQVEDPENAESQPMMRAVIEEAGRLESAILARRILDPRRTRHHVIAALGAWTVLLLVLLVTRTTAAIWAQRNLLLRDVPWPQSTTLVVEDFPESGVVVVTRGDSLAVKVRALGKVPDEVEIHYRPLESWEADAQVTRMSRAEGEEDLFTIEFPRIPESFEFWVIGGDDDDEAPVYSVRALPPPTIETIRATCTYPAHTGLEPEVRAEGDLELPEGTEVRLELGANMPVRSARFAREGEEPRQMEIGEDEHTLRIGFKVTESFYYSIRILGKKGQQNTPESARFRIRSVPDRNPLVQVLHPVSGPYHTVDGLVPFKFVATDNYGITRLSLLYRKGSQQEFAVREFAGGELSAPPGAKEIVGYVAIPVRELTADQEDPVRVGELVTFVAETEDNNGNFDRSDAFRLEIVSEEELTRRQSQLQSELRRDALRIRRERQEPAYRGTTQILELLDQGGGRPDVDDEALREILVLQGAVTREVGRLFSTVGSVFNTCVYNRLTNAPATERILYLMDEFLKADHEDLATVFKKDLYRVLIDEYRAGTIRDQRTLAVLLEIMEILLKVGDNTSPAAHGILEGLSKERGESGFRESIERLRDLQKDILADFDLLDLKMQQWETYAEIIELVRKILDTQKGVRGNAERLGKER